MSVSLLIHPNTHVPAAELIQNETGTQVVLHDTWLLQIIKVNGIAVPRGFAPNKPYIFPTDLPDLFARAFTEHFFPHGLTQAGFYWIKKEDYTGPEGEFQKALTSVLEALKKQ
jgi:hypothetical protein